MLGNLLDRGLFAAVLLSGVATGCDDKGKEDGAAAGKESPTDEAKKDVAKKDDAKKSEAKDSGDSDPKMPDGDSADEPSANRGEAAPTNESDGKDEDIGYAKLKLGDADWSVDSALAKVKEGTLRITASHFEMVDGKARREALTLVIKDYEGPGSYVTKGYDSNFSGVGFDSKKIEEAEKEGDTKKADAEATKEATKALGGASIAMMKGAKVEITAADENFIDGTVQWKGALALRGPKSISGEFHARISKKRKKKKKK